MRYLIAFLIVFSPFSAFALAGDASRFDFGAGAIVIVDDTTTTCNNEATVRFDFIAGQITEVFDTTATCTAAVVTTVSGPPVLFLKGSLLLKGSIFIR